MWASRGRPWRPCSGCARVYCYASECCRAACPFLAEGRSAWLTVGSTWIQKRPVLLVRSARLIHPDHPCVRPSSGVDVRKRGCAALVCGCTTPQPRRVGGLSKVGGHFQRTTRDEGRKRGFVWRARRILIKRRDAMRPIIAFNPLESLHSRSEKPHTAGFELSAPHHPAYKSDNDGHCPLTHATRRFAVTSSHPRHEGALVPKLATFSSGARFVPCRARACEKLVSGR